MNISAHNMLNRVLKVRKQSVGELLRCIQSVNALKMTGNDFGECRHTVSSEPFFYDQSYEMIKHTSPIVVDGNGRCVMAEEEGERDANTKKPLRCKCTSECKLPTSSIIATKQLFDKPIQKLREGLINVISMGITPAL